MAWEHEPGEVEQAAEQKAEQAIDIPINTEIEAYLCGGEEDWYRVETEGYGFEQPTLELYAFIEGAEPCEPPCGGGPLESHPKHTITVEVYRADTEQLLLSQTDDGGVVVLQAVGDTYAHDLLVRVHAPAPAARYAYRFSANFHDGGLAELCGCGA
jgi:hypothetical protein